MEPTADVQQRARAAIETLRPHPHRGDLIAAGAVPFTVALLLINVRLDGPWGSGVFLVLDALACALVLGMGVLAPIEDERPRAYQMVLQLAGLVLLFVALLRLAQVLGAHGPLDSAGSSFWILTVETLAATWLARARRNAVCILVAGITGTFAALAFVDWVFHPGGAGTIRWILLLVALGLLAGALVLRERRRRESVYLIDAAGFAMLLLGATYLGALIFGLLPFAGDTVSGGPGAGWKIILLAAGLGLVAYAGVDREPGPGYLGALILLVFVVLVGLPGDGGASLWFWPLVLLLVGGAMIAAGLRPREPLPPEPAVPGRTGEPARPVSGPFPGGAPPTPVATPSAPPAPAAAPEPAKRDPAPTQATPPDEQPTQAAPAPRDGASAEPTPTPVPDDERPARTQPASHDGASADPTPPEPLPDDEQPTQAQPPAAADPQPTRPQPPVVSPEELATERAAAARERAADPEPPATGSLWARPDPGEQPTRQHRVARPEDDEPTDGTTGGDGAG